MFGFIKKKLVAATVKSFLVRFSTLDSLHKSGKISDSQYQLQKAEVTFKYQDYIRSVPEEMLPDYVRQ